ncbi:hypothetical protein [Metabacillus sp. Hm71]|uniref:hypothetical protein n=1 Tax=Metabacillus sp. Hm71 TaxID=3450743 RepID=UPI003F41C07B
MNKLDEQLSRLKEEHLKIEIPDSISTKIDQTLANLPRKNSKRIKYRISYLISAAVLMIGLFTGTYYMVNQPSETEIINMDVGYEVDVSDPRKLVGYADHVFIGKVIEQAGTKKISGFPETQFNVKVLETIKGDLNGTIIVNQNGGYDGNQLTVINGDSLIKPGKTYLFATKYLESENWHTLVPAYGDVLIENEEKQKELIETYKKAYENQIPYKIEP